MEVNVGSVNSTNGGGSPPWQVSSHRPLPFIGDFQCVVATVPLHVLKPINTPVAGDAEQVRELPPSLLFATIHDPRSRRREDFVVGF